MRRAINIMWILKPKLIGGIYSEKRVQRNKESSLSRYENVLAVVG